MRDFPEVMTCEDLADFLQISRTKVYQLKAAHKLPFRKIGGSVRFLKSEIIEYIKNN